MAKIKILVRRRQVSSRGKYDWNAWVEEGHGRLPIYYSISSTEEAAVRGVKSQIGTATVFRLGCKVERVRWHPRFGIIPENRAFST